MFKPFLAAVLFSIVPLSAVAQEQRRTDYTGATLQQQQYEIYELNRRLQVQSNQREIERLQERVANGGTTPQPQPVIVEQRVNPLVPLIGAALIGGAIIYSGERNNRYRHTHRHNRYHHNGRRYRICRDHKRRYYC